MKIEIEKPYVNNYTVRVGDTQTGELTWDEMLGHIAKLTLTGENLYAMHTDEQWATMRAKWKAARGEESNE